MGGDPGVSTRPGVVAGPRFHFCPECPEDERGNLQPMKATMAWPGKRIVFKCQNGHTARKGHTLLR